MKRLLLSLAVALLALAAPDGRAVGAALPDVAGAASANAQASVLAPVLQREVEAARRVAPALGVHVVDLASQHEVFAYQPDLPRILASNTKLLTTAAALHELGPDYRFVTRALVGGSVENGTLQGDFAIIGSGDPNLSGRFHDGDVFAVFRPWAAALAARGVRRIAGDLVLVNGMFEGPRVHPDWPRDQLTTWYEAPVEALSFSDNCVLVRVRPGRTAGSPAIVETVPKLDYFRIENTARTGEQGGNLFVTRREGTDVLVVGGRIGRRSGPLEVWVAVHDPTAYFAAAVRAALAEAGIEILGGTRPTHGLPPGAWEEVARHESDLERTLAVTNKRSQNFYAECLAKLIGLRLRGQGSWPAATAAIGGVLTAMGVDPTQFTLADGSGMSRGNQATPRVMTTVLARMYQHTFGREYVRSLPYSGEEGLSWRRRLASDPYRGNVFAKTGHLNGVTTLSGYAKATSGRVYAFSILCNSVRSSADARAAQDRIVKALIDRG